jgi:putative heme-binding domain-containing protein
MICSDSHSAPLCLCVRYSWRCLLGTQCLCVMLCLAALIWPQYLTADDSPSGDLTSLVGLLELLIDADPDSARQCLQTIGAKIRSGEVDAATLAELKSRLAEPLGKVLADHGQHPLSADAALVAALWGEKAALARVRALAAAPEVATDRLRLALETLVFAGDASALKTADALLASRGEGGAERQAAALSALSRAEGPDVAKVVLARYAAIDAAIQPQAIELLTQRAEWGKHLVAEVAAGRLPPSILNVNQVRKLLELNEPALTAAVAKHWGTVRTARDPAREQFVAEMKKLIRSTPGDPHRGIAVFNKLCGQCHKIHGQGQEVGPDITANGRASFDQLLSNVFDPSLVIGASYQARVVRTIDGRVITGLVAEDSDERVVLKVQGGKLETIAREDVEAMKVSELSLMPEGIEKQLQPQEIADLFAFITLDKHPDDKTARRIPGTSLAPGASSAP